MQTATAIILNTSKPQKTVECVKSLLNQKINFELKIVVVDNSESIFRPSPGQGRLGGVLKNLPIGIQLFFKKNKTASGGLSIPPLHPPLKGGRVLDNKKILSPLAKEKNVELIFTKKNGYSYGNNLGAEDATGEIYFIVNPDISVMEKNALQDMAKYLKKNTDVAILGPQQKNPDGSIEKNARRFPTFFGQFSRRISFLRNIFPFSALVKKYEFLEIDENKVQEVDWLQSSFWAIRADFWKKMGGFDEKYFIFMADVDLCKRAWRSGKKVVYYPKVHVLADGIRCSQGGLFQLFTKKILRTHVWDALKYHWTRIF